MAFAPPTCRRRWFAVALLALVTCRDARPTLVILRPGLSVSGYLAAGSVGRFAFDLRRGQYAALRVTQESVDVALTVHPPDGRRWAPLDTQTVLPLPEVLWLVAASDGRYVLDVAAAGRVRAGPFRLEVTELRPATTRDQVAVDAQNRLAEAEELRRHNEEASDLGALPIYEEAVRLFGRAGEADGEGYARLQWARVLARRGRKVEAAATLRRCLGLPVLTQRPGTRARAASLLAEQLSDLGESAAADAADLEALGQWQQLQRPDWQAIVINDMAHRAAERGELARAEGFYLRALRLFERHGGPSDAAVALGNLASVYNLAGEPQLALDAAEQGIARFPQDASPSRMAEVLAQQGEALAQLDRREAAQAALAKALKLLEKGAPAERAQLERRLARRAYDRGDFDEAAQRFRSALTALEAAQDRSSAVATRQDLAWTELKRGHLEAAERLFQSIPGQGGPLQNHWIEPAALAGRARLERARGHLELALGFARRALDGVELLRREVGRTDLKTSVFAGQQSYFDLTLDLLFELFDRTGDRSLVVESFEVSERSRARRLLDLLVSGRSLSPAPNQAADDFAVRLSQAEERLGVLRSAGAEPAVIALAERQVREAVLDLHREQGLSSAVPGLEETPLSLAQIQRWIDPDTVLLEFHLGEDASYLWVVSRRQLVVHRLPRQEVIESAARRALGVLSSQGIAAETVQGRQTLLAASRLLVGAAMPELASRRWLFSMDGVLHALPLGALPNPTSPGEPILATHEVAYSPSASVAVRLAARARQVERKPRREVAMFADPVYEPASSAPLERSARHMEPPRETSGALRSPGNSLLRLPRLRYAGDEARRILALAAPAARLEALRYAATKARVLSGELADYRYLHFAVHGLPDENHPELSAVALSTFDARGKPQDGILFAHEIARLRLPADLVVLSACQSGRGAAISGEGLVGLVQAFFTAGSAHVVASEWAVNDQATAVLMGLFYDGLLGRHLDPARALEEAQLALARERAWRRPYFWAGFVVEGGF